MSPNPADGRIALPPRDYNKIDSAIPLPKKLAKL